MENFNNGKPMDIASIPKDELNKAFSDWSEGSKALETLLWNSYNKGIKTWSSCAGVDINNNQTHDHYISFVVDYSSLNDVKKIYEYYKDKSNIFLGLNYNSSDEVPTVIFDIHDTNSENTEDFFNTISGIMNNEKQVNLSNSYDRLSSFIENIYNGHKSNSASLHIDNGKEKRYDLYLDYKAGKYDQNIFSYSDIIKRDNGERSLESVDIDVNDVLEYVVNNKHILNIDVEKFNDSSEIHLDLKSRMYLKEYVENSALKNMHKSFDMQILRYTALGNVKNAFNSVKGKVKGFLFAENTNLLNENNKEHVDSNAEFKKSKDFDLDNNSKNEKVPLKSKLKFKNSDRKNTVVNNDIKNSRNEENPKKDEEIDSSDKFER